MKKFRKIMAVLVAAMMIMATMVPAFAETGDITKEQTVTIRYNPGSSATGSVVSDSTNAKIPAMSNSAYFQLKTDKGEFASQDSNKPDFLGWSRSSATTRSEADRVDRILITRADVESGIDVYAIWGKKADHGENHDWDKNGSIIIQNSTPDETYTAYQLLMLYSWNDENELPDQHANNTEAYSYYIADNPNRATLDADDIEASVNPMFDVLKDYSASNKAFKIFDGTGGNEDRHIDVTIDGTPMRLFPVEATSWFMDDGTTYDEHLETEYQSSTAKRQAFASAVLGAIANFSDDQMDAYKVYSHISDPEDSTTYTVSADKKTTTISGLPLGYYLVDSSLGTLCMLDTITPNVTMVEKNSFTVSTKQVQEDSTEGWGDKNDADFGQKVEFKSLVTIPRGQSNVVFHDKMQVTRLKPNFEKTGAGLVQGIKVTATVGGVATTLTHGDDKDYVIKRIAYTNTSGESVASTFSGDESYAAEDTFAIVFNESWTKDLTGPATVTIEYEAILTENALVGEQTEWNSDESKYVPIEQGKGNDNESYVSYGDAQSTEKDWTRTYTWKYSVFKYTKKEGSQTYQAKTYASFLTNGELDYDKAAKAGYVENTATDRTDPTFWVNVTPLKGAKFSVNLKVADERDGHEGEFIRTPLDLIRLADEGSARVYRLALDGDNNDDIVTEIETPDSGLVYIKGLDAAVYEMAETKAPEGYDKLHYTFDASIESDTKDDQGNDNVSQACEMTLNNAEKTQIDVPNFTSKEMPMTGGMGTTVLYIVGGMLVILAGAYLFFSRKRTA